MGDPQRGLKFTAGNDAFSKHGIRFDDHHFKDPENGTYQTKPPDKLKSLYHQGPPAKLSLRGPINSLKQQSRCLGVYKLMPDLFVNGQPAWKHCDEDLLLASSLVDGDEGWVVAQFTTFSTQEKRCMTLPGHRSPFDPKRGGPGWSEWDGRSWVVTTVKCRASTHGWGEDGVERQQEHDRHLERHGGSPTRARKSPPTSPSRN